MNTALEKIDVTKPLENEDFVTMFTSQLPLNEEEIDKVSNVYYAFYTQFISSGVSPVEAWTAIKNLFVSQETQVGERIKNGND